jgi:hypothetical protein
MRHVRWARRIPAGRPIHVFGAGAGGLIVHDALRDAGVPVEGFVDDRVAGPVRDLPVRRLDAFAAGSGRTATVAIASRHWRTIARTLRAHAIADVVDASAIIWCSMPWFSGQRLGTLPALEAAMRAATGIGIEDLVGALGLSRAGNWGACAALLAAAGGDRDLPVFVEGTGAVAKDIRTFVNDLPGLHVVGHIEDGPPGFLDFLDRCSWDTFLADGPPDDALVVVTGDRGRALVPALRLLGITRIVVWEDQGEPPAVVAGGPWPPFAVDAAVTIVVDGADPALAASTVASVLDQTHPGVACLLHGVDSAVPPTPHPRVRTIAADLPRALAACATPLVGHVAAGTRLRPDAVATALARLVADPDLAGVVAAGPDGDAPATGIDLLDRLFGPPGADVPDGLFRRAALVEAGAAVAGSYELFCRLAFDMRLAALPLRAGAPAPPAAPVDLGVRADSLAALSTGAGPFDLSLRLEALVRQFVHRHDVRLASGLPPSPPLPGLSIRPDAGPIHPPPLSAGTHAALGQIFDDRGQIEHALAVRDAGRACGDALLDALACQAALKLPGGTGEDRKARQIAWAARHAPFPRTREPVRGDPRSRPLTVGYLCAYGGAPYFEFQILPFVAKHDRTRVRPICYLDQETPRALRSADAVRAVRGLSDAAFRDLVRADGVDVLVDVTGFGPDNRYRAMGMRCAPVQVSYCNHAGTTGVPNVDYVLADAIAVPPALDIDFTERVHRLPGSFFCFDFADDTFPDPAPVPSLAIGTVTFGCFGSGSKINDALVRLWARILERLPGSRLVLCNPGLAPDANRRFMERRFTRHGIAPDRLTLVPGTDREGIKRLYATVDVSLDTWPYCGGNTIAESLMSGVPCVTLLGDAFPARYGASLLVASGCGDLVADAPEAYVDRACALARDGARLAVLRGSLRDDMRRHGFSDSAAFAAKLEDAYLAMALAAGSDG